MYLKSLDLTGFKSFSEARIEFPKGVTAVVGPNGTGKSNVVDAILWVLGEQSTKTLRSEKMEDVIFNGTEQRKPLGMAEVSLLLAEVDQEKVSGIQGVSSILNDYEEVMITRRLYRDGTSEYLINKTPCRLKDIRGLLLDTRAGVKGHTVIEQGRIDQILNASPRERRELIEETAGIIRFKKQKAEALRKLESTNQNLLRVRDIVSEVRRQLNALDRQARQARNYQKLQDEAKVLEIRLLVREAKGLQSAGAEVESELAELHGRESACSAEQARCSTDLEAVRLDLNEGGETLNRIREALTQIEQQQAQSLTAVEVERNRHDLLSKQHVQISQELERVAVDRDQVQGGVAALQTQLADHEREANIAEQDLTDAEQRMTQLVARRTQLTESVEAARQGILNLTVEITNQESQGKQLEAQVEKQGQQADALDAEQLDLGRQCENVEQEHREFARRRGETEARLRQLRSDREQLVSRVQSHESQLRELGEQVGQRQEGLAAVDSRLKALEDMIQEEMGYGRTGEEEKTSLRVCEGIRESVAEWIVVPPGLERAIEAVLGERGRGWLVESPARACQAVRFLKDTKMGRGSFIPLTPRGTSGMAEWQRSTDMASESGVLGWALHLVSSATEHGREALEYLFQGVLIVETLDVAIRLWEQGIGDRTREIVSVTLAGEILDAGGVMTGGELESSGGLLQRRLEVQQLRNDRIMLANSVEEARTSRVTLEQDAEEGRAQLSRMDESIRSTEMEVVTFRKDEEGSGQRLTELRLRLESVQVEKQQCEQSKGHLHASIEQVRSGLRAQKQAMETQETALSELLSDLGTIERDQSRLQNHVTEARLSVARLQSQRDHNRMNLERSVKEVEAQGQRIVFLQQQVRDLTNAMQVCETDRNRHESRTKELGEQTDAIRARFVAAQEQQTERQGQSRNLENNLEDIRKSLGTCRESRLSLEVRRAEIHTKRATVEQTLSGTYQYSLEEAIALTEPAETAQGKGEEQGEGESAAEHLQETLRTIRAKLAKIGPVNLAAIEEQQALQERYTFLTAQEEDLSSSMKSLKEIIQRINRTTKNMFMETFNELQLQFGQVFSRFFPGGRAELILTDVERPPEGEEAGGDDRDDHDEPGVDIEAQPPGKRLKNITMLSGGEKTLTAMALIFASFLIRPTPFCILDEIDAPLDEENIGRFADVLLDLATNAQFVVITHNKRTMAVADSLFGVTMEEPGVSKLLSIRLADLQPA